MQRTIYHRTTTAVWADALFVSAVQRSDEPSGDQVRRAIAAAVRAHGERGCAERVAGEAFGWPEPAPDGTPGRPELPVTGSRAWRLAS